MFKNANLVQLEGTAGSLTVSKVHFGMYSVDTILVTKDSNNPAYVTGLLLFPSSSEGFSIITAVDGSLWVKNNTGRVFSMQGSVTYQLKKGAGQRGLLMLWSERSNDDGVTFTENPFSLRTSEVPNNTDDSQTKSAGVSQWGVGECMRFAMYNAEGGDITLDSPVTIVNGANQIEGLSIYLQLNEV